MSFTSKIKHAISYICNVRQIKTTANINILAPNELLKGRCALITGGTSGIGYSIAEAFLNAGASVVITGRNNDKLQTAISSLSAKGKVFGYIMDNKNVSTFESTFNQMLMDYKRGEGKFIDILVNNAGVLGANLPNATEEEFDNVIKTNLKAVFFLSQIFGKYMVKNNIKGNILNVASSSSLRPAISAYTVSKWGIRGLTMGLARSLAPYGITVNGIAPGQTATPMLGKNDNSNLTNNTCPLGRWILPEEIANGALFLVSDMGRTVIGDILYMTGGAALLCYEDMNYNIF